MYTNYSQLNMLGMGSSMGYQNFLGGGLGMGSFGMGSLFGTGFGGCNMFQSCDGSYNYDAMAGFGVASVLTNCLFGFLGQAVSAKKAKQAENPKETIESLTNKIAEQRTLVSAKDDAVKSAQSKINEVKNTTLPALNGELDKLVNDADYVQWCADYKTEADEAKLKGLKFKIEAHEAKIKAKRKEIADAEASITETGTLGKALKEAQKAYDTENGVLTTLQNQLRELQTTQQTEQDRKLFDKADGNVFSKRTGEKELYTRTFSKDSATEADIKGAIYQLGQAQKSGNKDTIKKAALKAKEVYDALPQGLQTQYSDAATAIQRYI